MKKFLTAATAVLLLTVGVIATPASAAKPGGATTIQSGDLYTEIKVAATPSVPAHSIPGYQITLGFDQWGYNYQGHMFEGKYCDSYRNATWCQAYNDIDLSMKWNDAWLANTSADGNVFLDRHYDFDTYIGSGAWLTNHQSGTYLDDNEEEIFWTYFVKIMAAPADATVTDGVWYSADDTELGPVIWGQFFVAQEVSNDPGEGQHGAQYVSPYGPGFGNI